MKKFMVRQKRSSVDEVEPPERAKCWRRGGVKFFECLVNTGKSSDGDQWVKETAGSKVSVSVNGRIKNRKNH